ncbi:hypothetical protein FOA52_003382 [Chlamydomonas sp. UWO 241]|nr:hypothetical protein FOA52_003382 [Chlamydomonas sp. UWO 241]
MEGEDDVDVGVTELEAAEADAAVEQLKHLSSVLEARLEARAKAGPSLHDSLLSSGSHGGPTTQSAFISQEDAALLEPWRPSGVALLAAHMSREEAARRSAVKSPPRRPLQAAIGAAAARLAATERTEAPPLAGSVFLVRGARDRHAARTAAPKDPLATGLSETAVSSSPKGPRERFQRMLREAGGMPRAGGERQGGFKEEMAGMDGEIDSFVSEFKYEQNAPSSALVLQTAWRARGPRLHLSRFLFLRERARRSTLRAHLAPLAQLVRASRHCRARLVARAFAEWRELCTLKMDLYRKAILKLKASMVNVRDSQAPNHLFQLCRLPGEEPWKARLSLGRIVANIITSQAPRRILKLYFQWWARGAAAQIILTCWNTTSIPAAWNQADICPLYKGASSGPPTRSKSYRGISLLPVAGKVYTHILLNRLKLQLEPTLHTSQFGFRPGRGTSDAIFTLRRLQEESHRARAPLMWLTAHLHHHDACLPPCTFPIIDTINKHRATFIGSLIRRLPPPPSPRPSISTHPPVPSPPPLPPDIIYPPTAALFAYRRPDMTSLYAGGAITSYRLSAGDFFAHSVKFRSSANTHFFNFKRDISKHPEFMDLLSKRAAVRLRAAAALEAIETNRTALSALSAFRFWLRWATVRKAEALGIEPPLFRPRMPAWDAWLWEHNRSAELVARAHALHAGFRLRHCFGFWRAFAARNIKVRTAFRHIAAQQIEDMMRYALNALKAHWHASRQRKRTLRALLWGWRILASRNKEVRMIAARVKAITRRCVLSLAFVRLRQWARASRVLSAAGTVRMWQRRTIALAPLLAWTGDLVHMWFVLCFSRWRAVAVARRRWKCYVGAHITASRARDLQLVFKGWRKAAMLRRRVREDAGGAAIDALHARWDAADAYTAAGAEAVGSESGLGLESLASNARPPSLQACAEAEREAASAAADAAQRHFDGSEVLVSFADFPMQPTWRRAVARDELLRYNADPTAMESAGVPSMHARVGQDPGRMRHAVSQLEDLEGVFNPRLQARQIMLSLYRDPDQEAPTHAAALDPSDSPLLAWRFGASAAGDAVAGSVLWQRLVGLAVTSGETHPEHTDWMVDQTELPLELEAAAVRGASKRARMAPGVGQPEQHGMEDVDSMRSRRSSGGASVRAALEADVSDTGSLRSLKSFQTGEGGSDDDERPNSKEHKRKVEQAAAHRARIERLGLVLSAEQQDDMFWASLCEAEQLLETAVISMLGVTVKTLPELYDLLMTKPAYRNLAASRNRAAIQKEAQRREREMQLQPQSPPSTTRRVALAAPAMHPGPGERVSMQGDLMLALLSSSMRHDWTFMAANRIYCGNRDRVISLGTEMHELAFALASHRPEFTLTRGPKAKKNRDAGCIRVASPFKGSGARSDLLLVTGAERHSLLNGDGDRGHSSSMQQHGSRGARRAHFWPGGGGVRAQRGAGGSLLVVGGGGGYEDGSDVSNESELSDICSPRTGSLTGELPLMELPPALQLLQRRPPALDLQRATVASEASSVDLALLSAHHSGTVTCPPSVSRAAQIKLEMLSGSKANLDDDLTPWSPVHNNLKTRPFLFKNIPRVATLSTQQASPPKRDSLLPTDGGTRVRASAWRAGGTLPQRGARGAGPSTAVEVSRDGGARWRERAAARSRASATGGGAGVRASAIVAGAAAPSGAAAKPSGRPRTSSVPPTVLQPVAAAAAVAHPASARARAGARGGAAPYPWLGADGRLFAHVDDVAVPQFVPSLQDLEAQAQVLLDVQLTSSYQPPALPAIIFTLWGEPGGIEAVKASARAVPECVSSVSSTLADPERVNSARAASEREDSARTALEPVSRAASEHEPVLRAASVRAGSAGAAPEREQSSRSATAHAHSSDEEGSAGKEEARATRQAGAGDADAGAAGAEEEALSGAQAYEDPGTAGAAGEAGTANTTGAAGYARDTGNAGTSGDASDACAAGAADAPETQQRVGTPAGGASRPSTGTLSRASTPQAGGLVHQLLSQQFSASSSRPQSPLESQLGSAGMAAALSGALSAAAHSAGLALDRQHSLGVDGERRDVSDGGWGLREKDAAPLREMLHGAATDGTAALCDADRMASVAQRWASEDEPSSVGLAEEGRGPSYEPSRTERRAVPCPKFEPQDWMVDIFLGNPARRRRQVEARRAAEAAEAAEAGAGAPDADVETADAPAAAELPAAPTDVCADHAVAEQQPHALDGYDLRRDIARDAGGASGRGLFVDMGHDDDEELGAEGTLELAMFEAQLAAGHSHVPSFRNKKRHGRSISTTPAGSPARHPAARSRASSKSVTPRGRLEPLAHAWMALAAPELASDDESGEPYAQQRQQQQQQQRQQQQQGESEAGVVGVPAWPGVWSRALDAVPPLDLPGPGVASVGATPPPHLPTPTEEEGTGDAGALASARSAAEDREAAAASLASAASQRLEVAAAAALSAAGAASWDDADQLSPWDAHAPSAAAAAPPSSAAAQRLSINGWAGAAVATAAGMGAAAAAAGVAVRRPGSGGQARPDSAAGSGAGAAAATAVAARRPGSGSSSGSARPASAAGAASVAGADAGASSAAPPDDDTADADAGGSSAPGASTSTAGAWPLPLCSLPPLLPLPAAPDDDSCSSEQSAVAALHAVAAQTSTPREYGHTPRGAAGAPPPACAADAANEMFSFSRPSTQQQQQQGEGSPERLARAASPTPAAAGATTSACACAAKPGAPPRVRRTNLRGAVAGAGQPQLSPLAPTAFDMRPASPPSVTQPGGSAIVALGPVPERGELAGDAGALAEAEALRTMWSSLPYSSAAAGGAGPSSAWGLSPGAAVQALIEREEEDSWRQYEDGASHFVSELAQTLAAREEDGGSSGGGDGGDRGFGAPTSGHGVQQQLTSSQLGPAAVRGVARALTMMGSTVAASIDPSRLTGLQLGGYSPELTGLMHRLMVAPAATKYLFWQKVQGLSGLRQRLLEDRALEAQLRELAWADGFELPSLPGSTGTRGGGRVAGTSTSRVAPHGGPGAPQQPAECERPRSSSSALAPAVEASRWGSAHPSSAATTHAPGPVSRVMPLRPRPGAAPAAGVPGGARGAYVTGSVASSELQQALPFFSAAAGASDGGDGGSLSRPWSPDASSGARASQNGDAGGSPSFLPTAPPPVGAPPHAASPSADEPTILLVSEADAAQLGRCSETEALQRRQDALAEERHAISIAMAYAQVVAHEDGGMYVGPTPEDEAEVVDELARATVALHRHLLRNSSTCTHWGRGGRHGGGAASRPGRSGATLWVPEPREGYREGYVDCPDPFGGVPPRPPPAALHPQAAVSVTGGARPHAAAGTPPELSALLRGVAGGGGGVASASLTHGRGGGRSMSPTRQGPLAPIVAPVASPAKPGNVSLTLPRPAAYVERHLPPGVRDNALMSPAMRLSPRVAPAGPVVVSQPAPAPVRPLRSATPTAPGTPPLEGW